MEWILVTGGAGFIGSHVCERLIGEGYGVCIVDNMNNFYNVKLKENNIHCIERVAKNRAGEVAEVLHFYNVDITNTGELNAVFEKHEFSAVIHLAAYAGVRPSIEDAPLYTRVNVNGTVNILECMRKYGVRRLLFASSSSVYGNNVKTPFSEEDFVDYPISPYAVTKKAGELICYTYHHLYGINTACLRFFTVYGPRQRPDLAICKFTKLIYDNKEIPFYGDGSTRRDYTYITDILDGVFKAIDWTRSKKKLFEVFNLGESQTVSLSELIFQLEISIGKKAMLHYMPLQQGDVNITYADISKSRRILGYEPKVLFKNGIDLYIKWYKETVE